jgi:hypothetical protein
MIATSLSLLLALSPAQALTREQVIAETMRPYRGATSSGVDRRTLSGKVMTGYQGWFAAHGDGSGMGWFHWGTQNGFDNNNCTAEMWPDMSEYDADERYPTSFKYPNGQTADVFSSYNRKTVLRHFRWMKDYGIDGAFVQRFGVRIDKPVDLRFTTTVLAHAREGANLYGRAYAVMYDLTGLPRGGTSRIIEDWKLLVDRMRIRNDSAYLRHNNKPVVGVWGVGFGDSRRYTLQECRDLVNFLKNDPRYGGNTVVLGVPTYWRSLNRDSVRDPRLHDVIRAADIVCPWTIARYRTVADARAYARTQLAGDFTWCRSRGIEMMPTVFPGFSWSNSRAATFNEVPRQRGQFLWTQFAEARQAGARMVYQAMFDEVDEATAIFKVSQTPPQAQGVQFLTHEGQSNDHYLWLVGQATQMIRGATPLRFTAPSR